jgi:4-hydroxybutyryl-CoA dehydratase/vinylacetyl-CoA-Delta-isomerase
MGEQVLEPVDHPIIRPSINAVAETYDSPIAILNLRPSSISQQALVDLVMQNKMQHRLGQPYSPPRPPFGRSPMPPIFCQVA